MNWERHEPDDLPPEREAVVVEWPGFGLSIGYFHGGEWMADREDIPAGLVPICWYPAPPIT